MRLWRILNMSASACTLQKPELKTEPQIEFTQPDQQESKECSKGAKSCFLNEGPPCSVHSFTTR